MRRVIVNHSPDSPAQGGRGKRQPRDTPLRPCERTPMTGLDQLLGGFAVALSFKGLLYCFIGCLWGTIVGVLPGLGPLAGMTLLLPLTFGLEPTIGIIRLKGI